MVTFCVVCFRKSRRRAPPTGGRCWTPPQFMSLSPLSRPYRLLKQWPPPAIRQRFYRRGRPRPVLSKRPSKINPRRWRAKDKQILLSMSHPERKTRRLKALSLIGSLAQPKGYSWRTGVGEGHDLYCDGSCTWHDVPPGWAGGAQGEQWPSPAV